MWASGSCQALRCTAWSTVRWSCWTDVSRHYKLANGHGNSSQVSFRLFITIFFCEHISLWWRRSTLGAELFSPAKSVIDKAACHFEPSLNLKNCIIKCWTPLESGIWKQRLSGKVCPNIWAQALFLVSSKYENSTAMFCYTSFLACTHARPSIAIKDTVVFDQYFGLGPSSGSILMMAEILIKYYRLFLVCSVIIMSFLVFSTPVL